MIVGNEQMNLDALTLIQASDIPFYLTGSRFFGCAHDNSDWDFYTLNERSTILWLEKNYFVKDPASSYADHLTAAVYRRGNVHVQLVYNIYDKERIQNVLKQYYEIRIPSKDEARVLWRMCLQLI